MQTYKGYKIEQDNLGRWITNGGQRLKVSDQKYFATMEDIKEAINQDVTAKPWGGKREGAGRKPTGRSKHIYYITEAEDQLLRECLDKLRQK